MNHTQLTSSYIESAGYDPEVQVLEVKFKNGKVYRYADVPELLANQLRGAISPGKFFGESIKKKFTAIPVEEKNEEG